MADTRYIESDSTLLSLLGRIMISASVSFVLVKCLSLGVSYIVYNESSNDVEDDVDDDVTEKERFLLFIVADADVNSENLTSDCLFSLFLYVRSW